MADKYANLIGGVRDLENKFSNWWEKVKDCGIPVPRTAVFNVPDNVGRALFNGDVGEVEKWFEDEVLPTLDREQFSGPFFVKNSVFSNKFDARTCMCDRKEDMPSAFIRINEEAACVFMGYDGLDEFVVRKRIPYDARVTPCIYNGLPLRSEIRVFYDFDTHEVLFSHNYWDYDYVAPHLYRATDSIIFEHQREIIEARFAEYHPIAEQMVGEHMRNVEDMHGPWSVDLLVDEDSKLWLIDMAVAEQSAFWEFHEERMQARREGV